MAEFPVGDYIVDVVRDSGDGKRWIVNIRDSEGEVVQPLNREWFVNQGRAEFLALMPSSEDGNAVDALDGVKMHSQAVVEYMRDPNNE